MQSPRAAEYDRQAPILKRNMSKKLIIGLLGMALMASLLVYLNWHQSPLPEGTLADQLLLEKSHRRLTLLHNQKILKQYSVALGNTPLGHKQQEGDERTPEGDYIVDWRNAGSQYHLALHISYPNKQDIEQARAKRVPPGGDIMIHGLRDGLGWIGKAHRVVDWTNGCVAVTNTEVVEIGKAVRNGTPIKIVP